MIIVAISIAIWLDSAWMSLITIFLVATRQNLLGLLVHEQVHLTGLPGTVRGSDYESFRGLPPLGIDGRGVRAGDILAHHKYFYTEKDPDYARKSGTEWSIPMSRVQFARMFLLDILGINTLRLIRSKKPRSDGVRDEFRRRRPTQRWIRPTFWIIVAATLSYSGGWMYFLLYWVLPLLTVAQCLVRLGALSEHKYNVKSSELNDSTHLIELAWWERALLPNLNFTLHHYHHMFPGLSFSTLPLVHRMYREANLVYQENVLHGYADFIRRRILIE